MDFQILVFEHEKFGKVRCYIDDKDTANFNVEDISRGLGFVKIEEKVSPTSGRKTYTTIRWSRVNSYLKQFGFPKEVGENDYIPENMVYRLAMKAKNETAENFQAWLADDVVPQIRKTGSYSLPQNENAVVVQNSVELKLLVAPALKDVETSIEIVEKMFFVQHGIALAHCINAAEKNHQVDLSEFKNLLPPAEHEIGYLTATQIGKEIGKSAQYVNKKLLELEFQEKDGHGGYILTDKGKDYGEAMPFERNGHAGYQIKWAEEIVKLFN